MNERKVYQVLGFCVGGFSVSFLRMLEYICEQRFGPCSVAQILAHTF